MASAPDRQVSVAWAAASLEVAPQTSGSPATEQYSEGARGGLPPELRLARLGMLTIDTIRRPGQASALIELTPL